jgi:hydroxyquinol 1,2-dioxygenase
MTETTGTTRTGTTKTGTGTGTTGTGARGATEQELTDNVVASFDTAKDERFREVMQALVRHAHAFVRETRLTEAEWSAAIGFLTAAGHITTDTRQEFVLLSDVLGISMLTVAVNEPGLGESTESTVLGPFFVQDSPEIELGGDIAGGAKGEPSWVAGTVTDTDGNPVPGARIEVWEADDDGMYDVQYDDGALAGRAHLFADPEGRYRFWALTPTPYPIPDDGPVGRLLQHAGRSPMRAPHLHFKVTAPGFHPLITHMFVAGDPTLDSDSVFGVKESLVRPFDRHLPGTSTPDSRRLEGPWTSASFDIVLRKE